MSQDQDVSSSLKNLSIDTKDEPSVLSKKPAPKKKAKKSPSGSPGPRAGADPDKRPEKTDAVARRMIAAGLGLKAPKQTEEQRAYQRSAKAAIWDD
ncbi:hypothetical protein FoTM2_006728 [Fusarium oxysporum f. sp. vasinfectum]|nr:hypothetical protein FoTM2_006728 [Fusarium oxysporum f. sp. vasinfectum]